MREKDHRRGFSPGCLARSHRRGFTLVEIAVATAIVGIGVLAMVASFQSGTSANGQQANLTEATLLAQEIQEWTVRLPFSDQDPGDLDNPPGPDGQNPQVYVDDLDDLMGVTYSPPRDAAGVAIASCSDYSETITLTWRDPSDLSQTVADGASDVVYVRLDIARNGKAVLHTGWLVTRKQ